LNTSCSDSHSTATTTDTTDRTDKSVPKMTPKEHKEDVKRRRTRRSKKRKWQRLEWRHKRLQWTESTEQEVKRLHMKVVEHGQPLAPYNTTQFLMNDHNCDKEIDLDAIRGRLQRLRRGQHNDNTCGDHNHDNDNDDDFYSSPEDESDYLQQQFHEAYDHIHAERLSQMSKNQLVDEYLQLEDRVEDLEKRLKESIAQTVPPTLRTSSDSEVQTDIHSNDPQVDHHLAKRTHDFQQELHKLSQENQRLRCDNERLEGILKQHDIPSHSGDQ